CFFFQAEDGIRDFHVTGVQTCALPISCRRPRWERRLPHHPPGKIKIIRLKAFSKIKAMPQGIYPFPRCKGFVQVKSIPAGYLPRSEERRVGKECSYPWQPYL